MKQPLIHKVFPKTRWNERIFSQGGAHSAEVTIWLLIDTGYWNVKYCFTVGNFHTVPGHIHKASAGGAVVVQAVLVCNPHIVDLVPVDS